MKQLNSKKITELNFYVLFDLKHLKKKNRRKNINKQVMIDLLKYANSVIKIWDIDSITYVDENNRLILDERLNISQSQIPLVLCDNDDNPVKITTAYGQSLEILGVNTDVFRKFRKEKTRKEIEEVEDEIGKKNYLRAAKIKERYYNLEKKEMYDYDDSDEEGDEINEYEPTLHEQKIIDDYEKILIEEEVEMRR